VPPKLEGLVAKRLTSVYRLGVRSSDLVKVKRKGAVPAERFKCGAPNERSAGCRWARFAKQDPKASSKSQSG
jgi:hypothetical protein